MKEAPSTLSGVPARDGLRDVSPVVDRSSPHRLRILQISPTYYPAIRYGGPIRSVHGLASALALRGHDVHVYTTSVDGDSDLDVPLLRPVLMDGVNIHYFRVPAMRRLYWSPGMGKQLRQTVTDFDVVHLQSVYLWPNWAGARMAEAAKVPYVISPRGSLARELIHGKSRWIKTAWIELIERRSLRTAAGMHVTSELESTGVKSLGLAPPVIFNIPNGVAWPCSHAPLTAGPFADVPRPYALYLGRINWKKGLDRLIAAWKLVPQQLQLLIAGNDEESYLPQLKTLALAEGVAGRVHFIGHASDAHKWALYESAEMFVLPSRNENFGNVVVEAMAMSCPVIVTPGVGLAPFVRDNGAGLVVGNDPATLAEAVTKLLADPARKNMGLRGRDAVMASLSWNAVAAQMESAYYSISKGRTRTERDQAMPGK